jgi:hypothetical protein
LKRVFWIEGGSPVVEKTSSVYYYKPFDVVEGILGY